MLFEVQARHGDASWHMVDETDTRVAANAALAAYRRRGTGAAVRILGPDANGVRAQLCVYGGHRAALPDVQGWALTSR